MKKTVILCANGLEECEALNVYDLLMRAGIDVKLVSITGSKEITSSHKLKFKTASLIEDINFDEIDAIILPGGLGGTNALKESDKVKDIILDFNGKGKLIAAICAAPSILGDLELVKDNEYTVYPGCESSKAKSTGERTCVKNNIITGRALGSAFEFASLIIEYLESKELADKVINQIYY